MENLRKFGIACWESKERVVLAIVVLVLGFRVYLLINPVPDKTLKLYKDPSLVTTVDPEPPPPPKPTPSPLPVTPLLRTPIFDYKRPSARDSKTDFNLTEEDEKLKLLRIIDDGRGGHKAQISTGASRKLLAEGASFESYTVMNIDYDTECVTIYSEKSNQQFELCLD